MFYRWLQKIIVAVLAAQMIILPVAPAWAAEASSTAAATSSDSAETATPEAVIAPTSPAIEPATATVITTASPPTTTAAASEPASSTVASSTAALAPAEPAKNQPPLSARQLMREYQSLARAEKGQDKTAEKAALADKLEALISGESKNLSALGVSAEHLDRYRQQLQTMAENLDPARKSAWDKGVDHVKEFFGFKKDHQTASSTPASEVKIPDQPAGFKFNDAPVQVVGLRLGNSEIMNKRLSLFNQIRDLFSINEVLAGPLTLPTLADVQPDGAQVVISSQISELAQSLHNNPLEIYNYVRQNISYEAYYGAKKGAFGCFREKRCNDVDGSSLLIALLRAAGIPARYVKGVAILPVETARQLVGVDETKTAYAAFYANRVPVFLVSGNNVGANYDQADFSNEKYLGVEWTSVEAFYDYDERGGNFSNTLNLSSATTTEALRALVQQASPEKQWLPLDAVVQPSTRTVNEIVADTAQFNSQIFWNDYLKYQGALSPLAKYAADLKSKTNKDILDPKYQSGSAVSYRPARLLPSTLPYDFTSGVKEDGTPIDKEYWSVLPDNRQEKITITLKRADNQAVVLTRTFLASEADNQPIDLAYAGATPVDQAVIDQNGGLAYTPAALVDILPSFTLAHTAVPGNVKVNIGDLLVMQFEYQSDGKIIETNQKFSVAGNAEGIYLAFAQVVPDPSLTSTSETLLAGNGAIAREYLNRLAADNATLARSLDYALNIEFSRAVVTQNRVLSKVNDIPTTFDFKGLTLDAGMVVNDYSHRGNYKNHRIDFRLLSGENASYYEGQLFTDLAGLNGISTVKGLQYAYANPQDYTVHVIDKNNEAEIDQLQLSNNTKQNLHSEVQKGNTVTTPNKPITKGAFTGLVYASIAPNGTGLYAIGEQVANGGWTTNKYTLTNWNDENNQPQLAYEFINGPDQFIYKDNSANNILCSIKVDTYNKIVGGNMALGWEMAKYGKPCMDDNANGPYQFGTHDHSFIVATDGAYFKSVSDNYDYWIRNATILSKFFQAEPKDPGLNSMRQIYPYWGTYIYNPSTWFTVRAAVFNPAKQQVYDLTNGPARRYLSSGTLFGKYLPNLLGYPTMNIATAAPYVPNNSTGKYQQFTNGTIYINDDDVTHPYGVVTFGPLDTQIAQAGGTWAVGFPLSDPIERNGYRYQLLQSDQDVLWKLADNSFSIIKHIPYNCTLFGDYADHWYDAPKMPITHLHGILDSGASLVQGLAALAKSSFEFALYHPELVLKISSNSNIFDWYSTVYPYLTKTNFQKFIAFSRAATDQGTKALVAEWDTSFGKKGCEARQWYIEGRLAGEFLQIYLPIKGVSLESKLSIVSKVDNLAYVAQLSDLTESSAKTFAGLAKYGPYENKAIFGVAQKYIDSGEAAWYARPLLYNEFDLAKAVQANYLRGDLENGFYSLQKAVTDPYLKNLSKAGDQIIFVLKQNGDMIIAPRGPTYYIPHAILSAGEPIREAGEFKFISDTIIEITNKSGHFEPSASGLYDAANAIKAKLPNAQVIIKPLIP